MDRFETFWLQRLVSSWRKVPRAIVVVERPVPAVHQEVPLNNPPRGCERRRAGGSAAQRHVRPTIPRVQRAVVVGPAPDPAAL